MKKQKKKHGQKLNREDLENIKTMLNRTSANAETKLLDVYLDEYNTVTEKITSLSLEFARGSYIIPISLVVGAASINFDNAFVNTIAMIMPIIVFLHMYNHIRYMALQFKLSGYARYIEEKINDLVTGKCGQKVLLWENAIARSNKQNFFEGALLGITYFLLLILVLLLAYNGLYTTVSKDECPVFIAFLISAIYYFSFFSIAFFLLFFTNEHNKTYDCAKKVANNCTNTFAVRKIVFQIITIIIIISCLPLSIFPLISMYKKPVPNVSNTYDYIVVLGNKSIDNHPSVDMKARLDFLLGYISDTDDHTIVLSGGKGEAEIMKDYLVQRGLKQPIILERLSTNTYENFYNFAQLVGGKVLVITSDYHIFRSNLICKLMGLNYDFASASSHQFSFIKTAKECFASYFELARFYFLYN